MTDEETLKMLRAIDNFHLPSCALDKNERRRFIFISNAFGVTGKETSRNAFARAAQAIRIYALNIMDLMKSVIKRRAPIVRSIYYRQTRYGGTVHINKINGTATIVKKNVVLKFFFKDQEFFQSLHRELLPISRYELEKHSDFFLLYMPILRPVSTGINDAYILSALIQKLNAINCTPISLSASQRNFLPAAKVSQIFRLHRLRDEQGAEPYYKIAQKLQKRADSLGTSLCHGDLWVDNVILDTNGFHLIDYDKSVYFIKAYDYVYFYLVSQLRRDRVTLEQFVESFDSYERRTTSFLNSVKGIDLDAVSSERIRTSMALYALIKLTEKDLRIGKIGNSIARLECLIEAL